MPVCARCGEEKTTGFNQKVRRDGSLYVEGTCKACQAETRKDDPRLPAWPFKFWLERRLERYAQRPQDPFASQLKIYGIAELANACAGWRVEPESMQRWFHHVLEDNRKVRLDVVDRALINEGSTMLWELVEMAEEHVWSNGYWPIEQALRRLEDLSEWKKWA
jgi:hypothetical protein